MYTGVVTVPEKATTGIYKNHNGYAITNKTGKICKPGIRLLYTILLLTITIFLSWGGVIPEVFAGCGTFLEA